MSFFSSITPKFTTFNKKSFIKSVDFLYNSLNLETIPAIENFAKANIDKINKSTFLKNAYKLMGIKGNNTQATERLKEFFIEVADSEKLVRKEVQSVRDVVVDKLTSVKEATLIKIVEDFNFLNLYVMDFLYMALVEGGDTDYPKVKIREIHEAVPTFVQIYKFYSNGKIPGILKEIDDLPDINLNSTDNGGEGFLDTIVSKFKFLKLLPATNGFIGNPIYHIRMWLVDREIAKYELLKEKRKELELKILELRYKDQGVKDPSIKQQIEYYENKLSRVEYDIAKIEKND